MPILHNHIHASSPLGFSRENFAAPDDSEAAVNRIVHELLEKRPANCLQNVHQRPCMFRCTCYNSSHEFIAPNPLISRSEMTTIYISLCETNFRSKLQR